MGAAILLPDSLQILSDLRTILWPGGRSRRIARWRASLCDDIAYWAPAEAFKTEVDFVLSRRSETIALEVKATRSVRPSDLRGLRAIAELRGLVRRILVFLGPRPLVTTDGIDVWPFDTFASALVEGALWP